MMLLAVQSRTIMNSDMKDILIVAAFLITTAAPASATGTYCAVAEKTPDGYVALREGPGVSYTRVAKLFPTAMLEIDTGTCREFIGRKLCDPSREWVFVEGVSSNANHQGWAFSKLLRPIACDDYAAIGDAPAHAWSMKVEEAHEVQCEKAKHPSEKLICGDDALADRNKTRASLVITLSDPHYARSQNDAARERQHPVLSDKERRQIEREWATKRNACGTDQVCLELAFSEEEEKLFALVPDGWAWCESPDVAAVSPGVCEVEETGFD